MDKIIRLAAIILIIGASITGALVFKQLLEIDQLKYRQEAICIQMYIERGVERKHIKTNDGACWVSHG